MSIIHTYSISVSQQNNLSRWIQLSYFEQLEEYNIYEI
jgi:hypothetical protein